MRKPCYLDQLMEKVRLVIESPEATLDRAGERG
jgi:hypothetical protein